MSDFACGEIAATAYVIVPRRVPGGTSYRAPSDKLNIAGVGGMGAYLPLQLDSAGI